MKLFFHQNGKFLFIVLITSIFILLNYISINKKNILLISTIFYLFILSTYLFYMYKTKMVVFISNLKMEIGSIHWPKKKEINQTALMVIIITLLTSAILWIIDSILTYIISTII